VAVAKLAPIAEERARILSDIGEVDAVLRRGAERANAIAQPNLAAVKDLVGLLRP
jgi:tryptophanyl-tRNA synthetase